MSNSNAAPEPIVNIIKCHMACDADLENFLSILVRLSGAGHGLLLLPDQSKPMTIALTMAVLEIPDSLASEPHRRSFLDNVQALAVSYGKPDGRGAVN